MSKICTNPACKGVKLGVGRCEKCVHEALYPVTLGKRGARDPSGIPLKVIASVRKVQVSAYCGKRIHNTVHIMGIPPIPISPTKLVPQPKPAPKPKNPWVGIVGGGNNPNHPDVKAAAAAAAAAAALAPVVVARSISPSISPPSPVPVSATLATLAELPPVAVALSNAPPSPVPVPAVLAAHPSVAVALSNAPPSPVPVPAALAAHPPVAVALSNAPVPPVPKPQAAKRQRNSKTKPAAKITAKDKFAEFEFTGDEEDECSADDEVSASASNSSDSGGDKVVGAKVSKGRKKPMPRITPEERKCVEKWLQKSRKDGKMLNARWIRNGGAKGQSMTATSSEVKTQGAYDALAAYVNQKLIFPADHTRVWTVDVAKRRWSSMYKSFKESMVMGSKSHSAAGCTIEEIEANNTSLLKKQKAKCGSFEILLKLYEEHPSVKPVRPHEVGSFGELDPVPKPQDAVADAASDTTILAPTVPAAAPPAPTVPAAAPPAPTVPAAAPPPASAKGKAPAEFVLKPSKLHKPMDLGDAYLQAQNSKTALLAEQGKQRNRTDMIIALSSAGKTVDEIAALLLLM